MRMQYGYVPACTVLVVLAGAPAQGQGAAEALAGAWAVETYTNANGESVGDAGQRGLWIFTEGGHYSAVFSIAPRPRAASHFDPTDEEKTGQWDTIIVNTGTYEVSGNRLTTRPMIAKSAEFVGGSAVDEFEIDGDTLTLKHQGTTSGGGTSLPGGDVLKLRRIE